MFFKRQFLAATSTTIARFLPGRTGRVILVSLKSKIYIAPKQLWLTLDAGTFNKIIYNTETAQIEITLNSKTNFTPNAYLRVNNDVELPYKKIRGAYEIELHNKNRHIVLEQLN